MFKTWKDEEEKKKRRRCGGGRNFFYMVVVAVGVCQVCKHVSGLIRNPYKRLHRMAVAGTVYAGKGHRMGCDQPAIYR